MMNALAILVLCIATLLLLWLGLKLLCHALFGTAAGLVIALCWGAVWGLAAAKHYGWVSFSIVDWAHIPVVLHALGWVCGIGAGLFIFFLLKDSRGDFKMIGAAALLTLLMGPAIVAAWSMYIGLAIFTLVLGLAAIRGTRIWR